MTGNGTAPHSLPLRLSRLEKAAVRNEGVRFDDRLGVEPTSLR
jgi:hypothetical protein